MELPVKRCIPPSPLFGAVEASGMSMLRKVVQKPVFENFDEESSRLIRSPTLMMRFIDSLRFHKPTEQERDALNLCSATERLTLHTLNDILLICGARKGFRFSSADITKIREATEAITLIYEAIDLLFKSLPLEVTQYKFPSHIKKIEDDASFLQIYQLNHIDWRLDTKIASSADAIRCQALHFQYCAREYMNCFIQLRNTARDVRCRFYSYLENSDMDARPMDIITSPEPEFEAKIHQPFPSFLYILIQKYQREQRQQSKAWQPSDPEPPVDSVGVFAVFLSFVLLNRTPLTEEELESLQVLLQVLKLTYTVNRSEMCIMDVGCKDFRSDPIKVTHTTLSTMLYEFLSTVRELRLVSRAQNLLPTRRRRKMLQT